MGLGGTFSQQLNEARAPSVTPDAGMQAYYNAKAFAPGAPEVSAPARPISMSGGANPGSNFPGRQMPNMSNARTGLAGTSAGQAMREPTNDGVNVGLAGTFRTPQPSQDQLDYNRVQAGARMGQDPRNAALAGYMMSGNQGRPDAPMPQQQQPPAVTQSNQVSQMNARGIPGDGSGVNGGTTSSAGSGYGMTQQRSGMGDGMNQQPSAATMANQADFERARRGG